MLMKLEVQYDLLEVSVHKQSAEFRSCNVFVDYLFTRDLLLVRTEIILALITFDCYVVCYLLNKNISILIVIHPLDYFLPHPVFNSTLLDIIEHPLDLKFRLKWMFVFEHDFHKTEKSLFYMDLDRSKAFIAFIFKYLCKKSYIMILLDVCFDSVDNRGCPLHD